MTTKIHSVLAAGFLCCSFALAGHVKTPAGNWAELRDKNLRMGLSVERVDRAITECRSSGLSVQDAEDLLCPVYLAHEEELPTDCLFIKIEEGLAKGIAWQDVHVAVDKRLECTRKADALVMLVRNVRGGQHHHLVQHICLALESGLPESVINEVLHRPARLRYGRMIHVVEAGESLQLTGLEPNQTCQIMMDCVDRNLNCTEIMRVVNVFQHGMQGGKDFNTLYATLWTSSAP